MKNKVDHVDFGKVAVLMGGDSAEREISLVSGNRILESLRRSQIDTYPLDVQTKTLVQELTAHKPDIAFNAVLGAGGEDGSIQGLLEYLRIPYTGSSIAGSAVTLDKALAKLIWESTGIPTPAFRLVTDLEAAISVMQDMGLPLGIKPNRNGSSIGVTKLTTPEQLPEAFAKAASYDQHVLIEPWIEGAEYTVGILGNMTLPVLEIQTPRDFYDFDAKYNDDATKIICPCRLPPEHEQQIKEVAFRAFQVTGCQGWGRVDIVSDLLGNFFLLEINTVPGMTEHSLVPRAAKELGLSFDELVLAILTLAYKHSRAVVSL